FAHFTYFGGSRMKIARFLIFVMVLSSLPASVFGQTATTSRITGLVTDQNGARVTGATVTLREKSTGARRTASTNDEGRYTFASLPPGLYDITVSAPGFSNFTTSDLTAEATKSVDLDVSLKAGGGTEQVTVTATGEARLEKDDSAVGVTMERE